ncbi:hypothetical protein CTI12_AA517270 [Artemisia annua]|uniref:Uncharacterized protein n=1 Tax=Artemisia annua TaxID=35608 RepID=A0A2U1L909_ARTAN|nr:hypothetical protein CTI12_AA517270 [Artemisia annua]
MVQHSFDDPLEGRVSSLEKVIKKLIRDSNKKQYNNEKIIWELKKEYDLALKDQAASIGRLENQVGKLAQLVCSRDNGELPSTTETNPKDLAHAITTRSGLNYKEPAYPKESETQVNSTPVTDQGDKEYGDNETIPTKERVRTYVPPIPFPERLKKEQMKKT